LLEFFQAGLSWSTILKKRENFREAFDGFDFRKIACYGEEKKQQLLTNKGIIRNRRKIDAAVHNAGVFMNIRKQYGSFDSYIWSFVNDQPIDNEWETMEEVPASTGLSYTISRDMKKQGFVFFGTTICYAFMQAIGMVNDHLVGCFRYPRILRMRKK
jgi:DNA-3-methyladenine glycosylase I